MITITINWIALSEAWYVAQKKTHSTYRILISILKHNLVTKPCPCRLDYLICVQYWTFITDHFTDMSLCLFTSCVCHPCEWLGSFVIRVGAGGSKSRQDGRAESRWGGRRSGHTVTWGSCGTAWASVMFPSLVLIGTPCRGGWFASDESGGLAGFGRSVERRFHNYFVQTATFVEKA